MTEAEKRLAERMLVKSPQFDSFRLAHTKLFALAITSAYGLPYCIAWVFRIAAINIRSPKKQAMFHGGRQSDPVSIATASRERVTVTSTMRSFETILELVPFDT